MRLQRNVPTTMEELRSSRLLENEPRIGLQVMASFPADHVREYVVTSHVGFDNLLERAIRASDPANGWVYKWSEGSSDGRRASTFSVWPTTAPGPSIQVVFDAATWPQVRFKFWGNDRSRADFDEMIPITAIPNVLKGRV